MKKILIVEDEKDIRESLVDMLTMSDFEVVTASDGKEGLFMASTEKPDLILSDIMMPEMDGFAFLDLVHKNIELAGIPFIFLTAKIEQTDLRKGMNLGADDYLMKPVKYNDLLAAINRRLEKARIVKEKIENQYINILNQLNKSAQHEFNTPLNGILGFAQLLKSRKTISHNQIAEFADVIEKSGYRLKATLDNILLYRSLITKNLYYEKTSFKVEKSLIEHIAAEVSENCERQNDLRIETIEAHQTDGSDENLEKIIHDLIDNAFKFSKSGEKVSIYSESKNNRYSIIISDNGRGMTPKQIANIAAFNQFDRKKYEQQGMGLGLFLSIELAKLNNWEVFLEQNSPNGVKCRLILSQSV